MGPVTLPLADPELSEAVEQDAVWSQEIMTDAGAQTPYSTEHAGFCDAYQTLGRLETEHASTP